MALDLLTAATSKPLTRAQVKEHLRLSSTETAEDSYLDGLIEAATATAEIFLCRALLTQTWVLYLDSFPAGEIDLNKGKIQSVTSVKYLDTSGTEQTLTENTNYYVDAVRQPGRIVLPSGCSWPTAQTKPNAVYITFVAGYGDTPNEIPASILHGLKIHIEDMYDNRGSIVVMPGMALQIPSSVYNLYYPHKLVRF